MGSTGFGPPGSVTATACTSGAVAGSERKSAGQYPTIPRTGNRSSRVTLIILVILGGCFLLGVVSVARIFLSSSETTVLRQSVMSAVPGPWEKKIAVRVGGLITGLVRAGAHFFPLDPEPRAALATLRGAEVGVYTLPEEPRSVDPAAILAVMDKKMSARGWDRGVGVSEAHQLVAVYFPHRAMSVRNVKCCVVVFQERNLVVAAVRGNLAPVLDLVNERLDLNQVTQHLALR